MDNDFFSNRLHGASRRVTGTCIISWCGVRAGRRLNNNVALIKRIPYLCLMSHTALTYHLVFGTYRREHVIDMTHERELYKFIFDFSEDRGIYIRRIGGMPDHVHILCDIPAKIPVSEYVKLLKTETSKFMRVNAHFPKWKKWADGYGAFTVDASLREVRRKYIMNQREHHASMDFAAEYRKLLDDAGISDD